MRKFDNPMDILPDGIVVGCLAGLEQANVEDHVDIMGAMLEHMGCLLPLGRGERGPKRKADQDSYWDACAGQSGGGQRNPGRVHHRAGKAVPGCLVAQLKHLGARGVRPQEGVIENSG